MNPLRLKILFSILLFALFLLPACKSVKNAGGAIKLKPRSSKFLLKKLAANRIEADWLSAKARITYKDDVQTKKFNANFRYRKDSLIWFNVKKATVEAVRVQITPDSFFLIDRLNKEYYINSIEAVEERFNLPQRTASDLSLFEMLEEILLGNPVFFAGTDLKTSSDDGEYVLKNKAEHFDAEYRIDAVDYLLTSMNFIPDDDRQYLKVEFDRSEKEKDYPKFSYFRTYKVNVPQQGKVSMKFKFSKLELNEPKNIKFEIPGNYKRIN